jgi:hypothetical protein
MRQVNWDTWLIEWAEVLIDMPHIWGQTDCLSLVSRALIIMYGYDVMELPKWDSREGLIGVVEAAGGPVELARQFGYRIPRRRAMTGDVALVEGGDSVLGFSASMVVSHLIIVAAPERNIQAVPLKQLSSDAQIWRAYVN